MNSPPAYHLRRQAGYPETSKNYSSRPPARYRSSSVDPFRFSYSSVNQNHDMTFSSSGSGSLPPPLPRRHLVPYRSSPHFASSVGSTTNRSAPFSPPLTSPSRYRTNERSAFTSFVPALPRSSSLSKFTPAPSSFEPHTPTYKDSISTNNYHTHCSNAHPSNYYSYGPSPPQPSRYNESSAKRSNNDVSWKFSYLSVRPSEAYNRADSDFRSPLRPSAENSSPRRRQVDTRTQNENISQSKIVTSKILLGRDSPDSRHDNVVAMKAHEKTSDTNLNNVPPPSSSTSSTYERRSSGLHGGRAINASSSSSVNSVSSSSSSNAVDTNSYSVSFSSVAGLVGLSNLGNTCFMNSIIQCLSNTRQLLRVCLDCVYQSELNVNSSMKGNLFTAYAELMRQMWVPSGSVTYVSPQRFRSQVQKFAPRFLGYAQQDAQEFLRYLVQGLHEDVNRVTKRPPSVIPDYDKEDRIADSKKAILYWQRYKRIDDSIIADLFLGQLMSTLECMSCGHKSTTFDPFWDLSLPIPRGNSITILNCFDLFTSNEILDGAEQPICSGCKSRQPCRKSFSIQRFPTILVIHFKRFSGEQSRSKLTAFIDYPVDHLDLNPYVAHCSPESNTYYRLYAVSNHSGSVFGGHYTACCLHSKLGSWFEFNDTRVRPIRKTEAISSEAYVLFYQRIDS